MSYNRLVRFALVIAACGFIFTPTVLGQEKGEIPKISGPAKISLGDHLAQVDMPSGYAFIKKDIAEQILKENGSSPEGCLGMIIPQEMKKENSFFVVCRFEDIGHVKDDDADKLNADEILNSYKDGCKDQNEERKEQGIAPIYVGGWAEKPRYERKKHQVVWALEVKDEDSASAPVTTINYNTRILGRRGVLSMNLVTDPDKLSDNKKKVAVLLDDTKFVKGSAYEDYQAGKDKDSGLGIAGLILGGGALAVAAKMGAFGAVWKFILPLFLVCKKFIVVLVLGIGAALSKLFGKKKSE